MSVELWLLFLLINGIVLYNACLHDPRIGYDATHHLRYIEAFSKLRLVSFEESGEFFSPPLPYLLPALLIRFTGVDVFWAAKLGQGLNVLLSLGVTFLLLDLCRLIDPRPLVRFGALAILGLLPVYYRTFAFFRGEPYVLLFAMLMLHRALLMALRRRFTVADGVILGTAMGLCALSRQWGILLFPATYLFLARQWLRLPRWRREIVRVGILALVLAVLLSGWFYLSLKVRYGAFTAFNRWVAPRFSLRNQPPDFYFDLSLRQLFTHPIRPNFGNHLWPTLYSEVWGDYWCYLAVYGLDTRTGTYLNGYRLNEILRTGDRPPWLETNYEAMGAYLGRVNLVSLFPSLLMVAALGRAAVRLGRGTLTPVRREAYILLLLAIATTAAGYFWFLIMYPSYDKGDTIKATYILQLFPAVAVLTGEYLASLRDRFPRLSRLVWLGLALTFVHNLPATLTHFVTPHVSRLM